VHRARTELLSGEGGTEITRRARLANFPCLSFQARRGLRRDFMYGGGRNTYLTGNANALDGMALFACVGPQAPMAALTATLALPRRVARLPISLAANPAQAPRENGVVHEKSENR
jgi:hypothetical protein